MPATSQHVSRPAPRPARVFISSVFGGMMGTRVTAADTARLVGFDPVLPEQFVAAGQSIHEVLARELALADTYVGLFSTRYGTVPGREQWSVSELEYRTARDLGRRCLVLIEGREDAQREPALQRFITEQVLAYHHGVYPAYFEDHEALNLVLAASLSALLPVAHLAIGRDETGSLHATLHREGLGPAVQAHTKPVGPLPMGVDLSGTTSAILRRFFAGPLERGGIPEQDLAYVGRELWALLPPAIGESLAATLEQFAAHNTPFTLLVRSSEPEVLAMPWELLCPPSGPLFPVRGGTMEVVRRLLAPGESPSPADDPAPTPPRPEFAVLGFTAEPIETEAAQPPLGPNAPLADAKLFWELEQDRLLVALDAQLRSGTGSLILPDTGEASLLEAHLKDAKRPTIAHISCHGGVRQRASSPHATALAQNEPVEHVLRLEADDGRAAEVGSEELLRWMRSGPSQRPIELLVLAACETASFGARPRSGGGESSSARTPATQMHPEGRTGSLADELSRGGARRVIGMQASVSDSGATAFAEAFYRRLADGFPLAAALSAGRAAMCSDRLPHEWALPVLQVREHLGPLVSSPRLRPQVASPLVRARESFKIAKVSYLEEGYVGRRVQDRRLHQHWRGRQVDCGKLVVLHGLGGIGKSTLAARFLERRVQEGVAVLAPTPRHWTALGLVAELAARLSVELPRETPATESDALRARMVGEALGQRPTVLLLDNFEDSQQEEDGSPRDAALGEVLRGLAIDGGSNLFILLTSRQALQLGPGAVEPVNLDLGALSPAEARKFKLLNAGLRSLPPQAWARVMENIGGHPKALELLGGYLAGSPDRLGTLLDSFDEALGHVEGSLAAERQKRGRKLLLDQVVGSVPAERLPALDRLSLLHTPLPTEELIGILKADGLGKPAVDIAWLRGHGFLAMSVAPTALAGGDLVHRLVATRRRNALKEREGVDALNAFHRRVAQHFDDRPGGLLDLEIAAEHWDAAGDRAAALERFDRMANVLNQAYVYAAAVETARRGLDRFSPGDDQAQRVAAASLWRACYCGYEPLGRVDEAEKALVEMRKALEGLSSDEAKFLRAGADLLSGQEAVRQGKSEHALELFTSAANGFSECGGESERAIALGGQARLRAQAGDVEGALKLHEERLRIFEKLGDVRSRAVTLGDVARLRAQAGDVEGARRLEEERLEVLLRLGDVAGVAHTLYQSAMLDLEAQRWGDAATKLGEAWPILLKIGQADGIAVVGSTFGQLLAAGGRTEEALTVLEQSRQAWMKLQRMDHAKQVADLMEQIRERAAS